VSAPHWDLDTSAFFVTAQKEPLMFQGKVLVNGSMINVDGKQPPRRYEDFARETARKWQES
jgi:hypothetical protein